MQQHDNHHLTSFTLLQLSWITLELRKYLKFIDRHFFILNCIYHVMGFGGENHSQGSNLVTLIHVFCTF